MPRMYFVGVSTAESSIHRVFPRWAEMAGVRGAELVGVDLPLDAGGERYRAVVGEIRDDPGAWGALVTTHKVGIYRHARDLFDEFDEDAQVLGEVSCIVKRERRVSGLAIDTVTAGLAWEEIRTGKDACPTLILGAGGAAAALAVSLYREDPRAQVTLTDVSAERLDQVRRLTPARCVLVSAVEEHDRLLAAMPSGSVIVNATGMGKDRPGSPISPGARFPRGATAWDFNYRGELAFLEQARSQGARAVDGWAYFLHGWSQIMARVLGFELTSGLFAAMREAAAPLR